MSGPTTRRRRTVEVLEGLAVGDALGSQYAAPFPWHVDERRPPGGPWTWTDDTAMAASIVEVLRRHGEIDQDALAQSFAASFDVSRGYGAGMVTLLRAIATGRPWRDVSTRLFGGGGSFGNGAAMRVAPIGAWFADDLPTVVEQAARSAEVTHSHPDGIAGAVAVAAATALATAPGRPPLIESVIAVTPVGAVRDGLARAFDLPTGVSHQEAAATLGNGSDITAADTVPLVVWLAARHIDDYEGALWAAIECGGDIDTTGAMVGGIVTAHLGAGAIPPAWRANTEPLPLRATS